MNTVLAILSLSIFVLSCSSKKPEIKPKESTQVYSIPTFADSSSFTKLSNFFPVIDKVYQDYAEKNHFPSIAYGVVAGGQLIYSNSVGQINMDKKISSSAKALYRIASMSKSFTAMAILKLRDEGKLSLADPVSTYLPEINEAGRLTKDAPAITILNLLTMSAGFPEDNPWGDRQLADTDEELLTTIRNGLSLSNVPGVNYEYSNLGFAMLGKIISNVSGIPYQDYITQHILKPLGMNDTQWEFEKVPADQLAHGYRWEDEQWKEEALLHDGSYGAMGGMICSIEDFSKYVSLHLSAWPARNSEDVGPVKRSSIREMHQPWRFNTLFADAKTRSGEPCPIASGYGLGLNWRKDCNGTVRVAHSGGLPGFGSEWRIYPDYGIGVISFSNRTYGAPSGANAIALDTLIALAGLKPRVLPASAILNLRKEQLITLLPSWTDEKSLAIFAENFFPDQSLASRKTNCEKIFAEAGAIKNIQPLIAENQLRGSFIIEGETKNIAVFFTLTPEKEALIQQLDVDIIDK